MSSGRRDAVAVLGLALLIAVAASAVMVVAWPTSPETPTPAAESALIRIDAPDSIAAGASVTVAIRHDLGTTASATALVVTTAGAIEEKIATLRGYGELALGPPITDIAGITSLFVVVDGSMARADVEVVAGPTARPVTPLVGAKSIVADGLDSAMVVGLPTDDLGNPALDADRLEVGARRPGGRIDRATTVTTGLVQWARIVAGTDAGRTEIALDVGDATGPVGELDEVPGLPMSVSISIDAGPRRADGRTLHVITTEQLRDVHGNVLLDGTAVQLAADSDQGVRLLGSVTIDGRAQFVLEAPDAPGTMRVRAGIADVWSPSLTLVFEPAIAEIPARTTVVGDRVVLEVGPVVLVDGGFVPDGTAIVFRDREEHRESVLELGRATIELGSAPSGEAAVEVLGVDGRVTP